MWEKSILEYSVNLSSKSEGSNWIFSYNSPPESIIVEYSSEVYGNSDQKILLKSPNSIEGTASTSVSTLQSLLRGKFVYRDTNGTRLSPIKIGEDAVLSMPNGLNSLMITTWYKTSIGDEQSVSSGYVNSPSSDTYPPEVSDGCTYTALGQFGARAQIATGSYVGTGTYGKNNPNSLTFEFEPKLLFVAIKGGGDYGFYVYGQTNFLTFAFSQETPTAGKCIVDISGNTFTWYVTTWNNDAHGQLNYTTEYNYWAIG